MAINITRLAALAKRLIDENGRPITLQASSTTPIDPLKPWRGQTGIATENTPDQSVTATGVFLNQADEDNFGHVERDTDETLLKRGQQRVLVAFTDLVPSTDVSQFDILLDGTSKWRIVSANILQPGTVGVLYDFAVEQ